MASLPRECDPAFHSKAGTSDKLDLAAVVSQRLQASAERPFVNVQVESAYPRNPFCPQQLVKEQNAGHVLCKVSMQGRQLRATIPHRFEVSYWRHGRVTGSTRIPCLRTKE